DGVGGTASATPASRVDVRASYGCRLESQGSRPMRRNIAAVIALVGALVPVVALAQAAGPGRDTQLQQEMRHRRVIVRPLTPTDQVQQDLDRAAAEIQQPARQQAIVRDLTRPPRGRRRRTRTSRAGSSRAA